MKYDIRLPRFRHMWRSGTVARVSGSRLCSNPVLPGQILGKGVHYTAPGNSVVLMIFQD